MKDCVSGYPTFAYLLSEEYAVGCLGRCFVAVVEIETDRCAVCLAELDAVQSEADIQSKCPLNEGRQQTISR